MDQSIQVPSLALVDVVVFEDSDTDAHVICRALTKSRLSFHRARDANNWQGVLRYYSPRAVILDIMMPGKTGFQALREMRKGGYESLPVIVFSTKTSVADLAWVERCGATAFIPKPLKNVIPLMQAVRGALARPLPESPTTGTRVA